MRLTQFSDYALRTVLYLGGHPDRVVPVSEVARAYRISHNHLAKVAALLCELRVVEAVRGRSGGLRLAMAPEDINIGWLVRQTEPDFTLVDCFDHETDTCPISSECRLRKVLNDALRQFLAELDAHTLADFQATPSRQERLVQLWRAARIA